VNVVDTTPPALAVPDPTSVYATADNGTSAASPGVNAFLTSATAHDTVDPAPSVSNDAPAELPIGQTTVTFRAQDAAGNTSQRTSILTVVAAPAPASNDVSGSQPAPFKPPIVPAAPPDPSGFVATSGRGRITLRWKLPLLADGDSIELSRAQATAGTATATIYRGNGTSFVDRSVREGQLYRYQLSVVAPDGERSSGVAVTAYAQPLRLLAPLAGANVRGLPQFRWVKTTDAAYYNLQLFRGDEKVLSVWPDAASYTLPRSWRYLGRSHTLTSGTYRWYVWPGFGSRAARKYGPILGQAIFTSGL
jgi:hypothetical protein